MILYAVYFYVRLAVSYRDLKEIMAERGVDVDHATLNRWVEKYSVAVASEARCRKAFVAAVLEPVAFAVHLEDVDVMG